MLINELNRCVFCNSEADLSDWDAGIEMSWTGIWQTCTVRCSNKDCMTDVSLTVSSDNMKLRSSEFYENKLVELWNEIMKGENKHASKD